MLSLRPSNTAIWLAIVFAVASAALTAPATAQVTVEDQQLLMRIFDAANSVRPETAREAQALCVAIGKEVAARTEMHPVQRLTLDAEIERCISYAMESGRYSDETGDQCSHHLAYVRLQADAIIAAQGIEGVEATQFADARMRLEETSRQGPQMGCTGDYAAVLASLPATDAIASELRPGLPDRELMGRFEELRYGITAEKPEQWLALCRALADEVEQRGPTFHDVERWYFSAQVEDCIARTMAMSGFSDETGNACAHHHAFAENLSRALQLNKDTPFFDDGFRQYMAGELTVAMRQGPGMGCTEDYAGLAVE